MFEKKETSVFMRLKLIVGAVCAALALTACGGGGSSDPATTPSAAITPVTTQTTSGYTLQAGETVASGLTVSLIDGQKFYWAQAGVQYGTISFSNSAGSGSGTGALAVTAPTPSSSSVSWNAALIGTVMPIFVTNSSGISTFNIIAVASDHYVVDWTVANVSGTKVVRWYFGANASNAAVAFAGNPVIVTSGANFAAANFSGKTFWWVGGQNYQKVIFNVDGTLQATDSATIGVPGNLRVIGTWNVTNGILQVVSNNVVTAYTYNATVPLSGATYYRCIRDNGNINAFVYDANPTNELAVAEALAAVGGPQ